MKNKNKPTRDAYVTPELVVWARRKSGLTRSAISERMGIDVERLRLWESGAKRPTFRQAQRYAKVTDTPFGYLFLSAHNVTSLPKSKREWLAVNIRDDELLSCPFCGDAAQIESDGEFEDIACLNIYCMVQPRALGAPTRAARETWNTRHVERC